MFNWFSGVDATINKDRDKHANACHLLNQLQQANESVATDSVATDSAATDLERNRFAGRWLESIQYDIQIYRWIRSYPALYII